MKTKKQMLFVLMMFMSIIATTGCAYIQRATIPFTQGAAKRIHISSIDKDINGVVGRFTTGYCFADKMGRSNIMLIDGPIENPTQVAFIQTLWHPVGGKTPVDANAINATVQYYLFVGEEKSNYGLYEGAGYLYVYNDTKASKVRATLLRSELAMVGNSKYFKNLLGNTQLIGGFNAVNNKEKFDRIKNIIMHNIKQRESFN